eukprot:gene8424-11392_t
MEFFASVTAVPPNTILGLALACKNDPFPNKINLTIGAYRNDQGQPVVLDCVRKAEAFIQSQNFDHEYLVQDGNPEFLRSSKELMFGDSCQLPVYSIQCVAGTGALRLGVDLIKSIFPNKKCYIPAVTWPNHPVILDSAGVARSLYRYLDDSGCSLNINGLLEDLENCPPESVILFHACAHNPSGVDPTDADWLQIRDVVVRRNLLPFFDNAYQGFVSGDPEVDAFAVRLFAKSGINMIVACSFSKNFGLYGERLGVLHVVTSNQVEAENICTNLRALARALYSTCPTYGSRIVAKILNDEELKEEWHRECSSMANRINSIRIQLHNKLVEERVVGEWSHIAKQRGMFSYSGISRDAVIRLRTEFHIYMLEDGRISLAGLNSSNLDNFVNAIVSVVGRKV